MSTPLEKAAADLAALGCGDNSCITAKPRGMATNGGCQCPWGAPGNGMANEHRRAVQRVILAYRGKVKLLEDDIEKVRCLLDIARRERDRMRDAIRKHLEYEEWVEPGSPISDHAAVLDSFTGSFRPAHELSNELHEAVRRAEKAK